MVERIMMKTMSRGMMRGADADERWDDDADDDGTKVAVWGEITGKTGELKVEKFTTAACRKMAPVLHRSKSCHLATSCLFSTSHQPKGDKQACWLIGNRCYEWEREKQRKREGEIQTWRE